MKALLIFAIPGMMFAAAGDDSFMLRGATVHTLNGADIQNGSVLVRNGKIIGVGKNLAVPKDIKVIDGKGMQVYPGMIDTGTMGLGEIGAVRETSDSTEIGKFNPQLVALTAVNPSSEHIPITRANGITTVATMPEGQLITGQVSLMHLDGWTTEEMGIKPRAALHMRMPQIQMSRGGFGFDENVPGGGGITGRNSYTEAKKTFDTQMAELNEFFESARIYKHAKEAKVPNFKPDLKLDAMIPVIDGKEPILVTAIREREIRDALAFADKQKVKIILCEAPEAWKVAKEIKAHDVSVILGPTLELPMDEDEPYDRPYATPGELAKAGVKFSIGTMAGPSKARNLPYQAAQAIANGLPHDEAMKAITKNAAEIWGVGDQVGTIEEGKWADLVITDGDPLEAQTQIKLLFIKGKPVDLENKHRALYEKYLNRP